jgi:hypothetical protein
MLSKKATPGFLETFLARQFSIKTNYVLVAGVLPI